MKTNKFNNITELGNYIILKTLSKALYEKNIIEIELRYAFIAEDLLELSEDDKTELHHEMLSIRAEITNEFEGRALALIKKEG